MSYVLQVQLILEGGKCAAVKVAINNLLRNDFVLAAKIDDIYKQRPA